MGQGESANLIADKLGHFIINFLIYVCNKHASLRSKIGKRKALVGLAHVANQTKCFFCSVTQNISVFHW